MTFRIIKNGNEPVELKTHDGTVVAKFEKEPNEKQITEAVLDHFNVGENVKEALTVILSKDWKKVENGKPNNLVAGSQSDRLP